jgi:hypothetical protein
MLTTFTVLIALAAGQAADPASTEAAPPPPPQRAAEPKSAPRAAAPSADATLPAKFQLVKEGAPALEWGTPSRCVDRGNVYYRAQCDDATRRCLAAPDAELDDRAEATSTLERAPPCVGPSLSLPELSSRGYTIVPALAESPPGWYRDERQRVVQVDFDLNARYFLGGGWTAQSSGPWSGGFVVSGGGRFDRPFTWWQAPALARMHFLEGWGSVDGKRGELLVFGLDASRAYPTPLLRITTFFGKPRIYDPPLYFGIWAEALRLEALKTTTGNTYDRQAPIAAALTLDMWRSTDLSDFVRVRLGGAYEESEGGKWASWAPHAALEGEVTLGRSGFHHLRASAETELVTGSGQGLPVALANDRHRVTLKAEYEFILFAINNQPISLAVEAKGQKRDDVPDYPTDWIAQAGVQLRFSTWAPPRRDAKTQDSL